MQNSKKRKRVFQFFYAQPLSFIPFNAFIPLCIIHKNRNNAHKSISFFIEYNKESATRSLIHECQNQNMGLPYERTDLYSRLYRPRNFPAAAYDFYVSGSPEQEVSAEIPSRYTAGVYTASMILGGNSVEIAVTVDEDYISSIEFRQLDETVSAMYPLMEPSLESLSEQICASQSLENISYSEDSQYTSLMLLSAIQTALSKAEN